MIDKPLFLQLLFSFIKNKIFMQCVLIIVSPSPALTSSSSLPTPPDIHFFCL